MKKFTIYFLRIICILIVSLSSTAHAELKSVNIQGDFIDGIDNYSPSSVLRGVIEYESLSITPISAISFPIEVDSYVPASGIIHFLLEIDGVEYHYPGDHFITHVSEPQGLFFYQGKMVGLYLDNYFSFPFPENPFIFFSPDGNFDVDASFTGWGGGFGWGTYIVSNCNGLFPGMSTSGNDTDGDSCPDDYDACPDDPNKSELDSCGCGLYDTGNSPCGPCLPYGEICDWYDPCNGDPCCGDPCCNDPCSCGGCNPPSPPDACPNDPNKDQPGICGCGVIDTGDTDNDGILDCVDSCPDNNSNCGIFIPPGNTSPISPIENVGISLPSGTTGGVITATNSQNAGLPTSFWIPSGNLYFDIDFTGNLNGEIATICVTYPEPNGNNEANYQLKHGVDADGNGVIEPGEWETLELLPGYPDTINNEICAYTTSFSPFVVGEPDTDDDGIPSSLDNCPSVTNSDQLDTDADGFGDSCDACPYDIQNDRDEDGICESDDNCPLLANPDQLDSDLDGFGDVCDTDDDNDAIADISDNCPLHYNTDQSDWDRDGVGDACDEDRDGDNFNDGFDQCINTPLGDVINSTGCSIADLCSCANGWKNHGSFVKCVAHVSEDFVAAGLITDIEKEVVVSEAAKSSCGSK